MTLPAPLKVPENAPRIAKVAALALEPDGLTRDEAVQWLWWLMAAWARSPWSKVPEGAQLAPPASRDLLARIIRNRAGVEWRAGGLPAELREDVAVQLNMIASVLDAVGEPWRDFPTGAAPRNWWSQALAYTRRKPARRAAPPAQAPISFADLPMSSDLPPDAPAPAIPAEPSDADNLADERPIADADVYVDPTREPGYRPPAAKDDGPPYLLIAALCGGVFVLLRRRRRR